MKTISKSKLKANMLSVFREIEASGEILVVTDRNKPVLKISPIQKVESIEDVFGEFRGQLVLYEDINLPTIDEWGDSA